MSRCGQATTVPPDPGRAARGALRAGGGTGPTRRGRGIVRRGPACPSHVVTSGRDRLRPPPPLAHRRGPTSPRTRRPASHCARGCPPRDAAARRVRRSPGARRDGRRRAPRAGLAAAPEPRGAGGRGRPVRGHPRAPLRGPRGRTRGGQRQRGSAGAGPRRGGRRGAEPCGARHPAVARALARARRRRRHRRRDPAGPSARGGVAGRRGVGVAGVRRGRARRRGGARGRGWGAQPVGRPRRSGRRAARRRARRDRRRPQRDRGGRARNGRAGRLGGGRRRPDHRARRGGRPGRRDRGAEAAPHVRGPGAADGGPRDAAGERPVAPARGGRPAVREGGRDGPVLAGRLDRGRRRDRAGPAGRQRRRDRPARRRRVRRGGAVRQRRGGGRRRGRAEGGHRRGQERRRRRSLPGHERRPRRRLRGRVRGQ